MNLLNYKNVNLHDVYDTCCQEAEKLGTKVTGSEIVGLVPKDSLVFAGKYYADKENIKITNEDELVTFAVDKLELSDLYPFKIEEKVIEYMVEESGPLVSLSVKGFLSETASNSPAPGGGSVAALSGALGAALSAMVCNLTIGKEKYKNVESEIKKTLVSCENLRKKLTILIDEDTQAFNDVIAAFKLPKETEEQKKARSNLIQEGYKTAAQVPFKTAQTCHEILDLIKIIAENGNKNSITDAAVSALMVNSGVKGAILNVRINLTSIKDQGFVNKLTKELNELENSSYKKTKEILNFVENSM